MYDVVVIGQGLTGLLSAIWAREQGLRTALVATGTGKMLQSSGVMDLLPGSDDGIHAWFAKKQLSAAQQPQLTAAIEKFKHLTNRIGYPYHGDVEQLASVVTGAGYMKKTALYPATMSPLPEQGHVVVVGFREVIDFQPAYIKENLQKARPDLSIATVKISLGQRSQRTMTQLDAARLLDQAEVRQHCINQIKEALGQSNTYQPDLFIFPAALGVERWAETIEHFSSELHAPVTEAPGMPPNTTAIRLHERLKKAAVKAGVRFYVDTTVCGCTLEDGRITSLTIEASYRRSQLRGRQYILATGGILGGGLEVIVEGYKETALHLFVDQDGRFYHCPSNLFPAGASMTTQVTNYGITGGIYSIYSAYDVTQKLQQPSLVGGALHA